MTYQNIKGTEESLVKGYKGYQYYASPDSCTLALFDLCDEKHVDIQKAPSDDGYLTTLGEPFVWAVTAGSLSA